MCYANPVSAGSGNKIIPVSTGTGGRWERLAAPGCSSILNP